MAWANDKIYDAVAALPEREVTKPRRGVFKNIVHTLNHAYVIDLIFQAQLEGRAHGFTSRNTPGHPPLEELRRKQRVLDNWPGAIRSPSRPRAKVHFTYVGGGEGVISQEGRTR